MPSFTYMFSSREHAIMYLKTPEKYDNVCLERAINHEISEYFAQFDDKTKKPVLYIDGRAVRDLEMYMEIIKNIIESRNDIVFINCYDEVQVQRHGLKSRSVEEIIRDDNLSYKADKKIIKKFQKAPKTVKDAMKFASWYYGVNRPMIIVNLTHKYMPLDSLCDEDHVITHKIDDSMACKPLSQCAHPNCCVTFKLRRCSGCNIVKYCSESCQRADWKNHRVQCKKTKSVDMSGH